MRYGLIVFAKGAGRDVAGRNLPMPLLATVMKPEGPPA